jgi:sugar phosphate permease
LDWPAVNPPIGTHIYAVEIRTIAKVTRRIVPFLIVCYFVAYLDRVNVGFAALSMNQDLGLSQTAFGLGAGIFFIAYFIFYAGGLLLLAALGIVAMGILLMMGQDEARPDHAAE